MKKHDKLFSRPGLALTICLVTLFLAAAAFAADFRSVNRETINVRSGPGTNFEAEWAYYKDFPVQVLKRKGDWAQVIDYEGDKGWVFAPLLSKKKTVIVTVKTANMRFGPGTNYEIMSSASRDVVLTVGERDGDWLEVTHEDGTNGWIHKGLVWPSHF